MVFRSYSNAFKYSLRDLFYHTSVADLFTCENTTLFSRVNLRYAFTQKFTWYFTGDYIVNVNCYTVKKY